jgi:hypothetical protein
MGKSGELTSPARRAGRGQVTFDSGETLTIDACCLESLKAQELEAEGEVG